MFFVVSSDDTHVCPVCGGTLKYRDTRPRIRKKEGQADTSQKIACGKPESGKQEAPRLWGKRTANSSEIVHTVLGSLEAYLHSNPPDYRFQVESLLERKRQIFLRIS